MKTSVTRDKRPTDHRWSSTRRRVLNTQAELSLQQAERWIRLLAEEGGSSEHSLARRMKYLRGFLSIVENAPVLSAEFAGLLSLRDQHEPTKAALAIIAAEFPSSSEADVALVEGVPE